MEGMIIKYLGKYFELFLKNFSRENFKVEFFQKTATLTNLDLNEKVLQEILLIPPTLEVKSGKVGSMEFKIQNLTQLSKSPILLTLDRVDIQVAEPKEVSPMPDLWKKFNDAELKKKKEKGDGDKEKYNVLKNITIEIKELHVHVNTLGHVATTDQKPSLVVDLFNITIRSTDSNWQVVDLEKLKTSVDGHETFHKEIACKSLGISLIWPGLENPQTVLSKVPTTIHFMGKSTEVNGAEEWTEMKVDFHIEEVNFSWNQKQFRIIIQLLQELAACLSRHVPDHSHEIMDTPKGGKRSSFSEMEISYGIHMDHWAIELHEGDQFHEDEKGFSFFGFGFNVLFVPRRNPVHFKSLLVQGELPGHESYTDIGITSLSVRKMHLPPDRDHRFAKLVSQTPSAGKGELERMIGLKYVSYSKFGKDEVDQLFAEVKLNSIQFVVDVKEIESLVDYFAKCIPDSSPPLSSTSLADEIIKSDSTHKKLNLLEKYRQSGVLFEASNLLFVLPRNNPLLPEYPQTSLFGTIAKLSVTNHPQWTTVPYIDKGVNSLPVKSSLGFIKLADPSATKFQIDLQGLSLEIEQLNSSKESILKPTDLRICARLLRPQNAPPSFETGFHSGEINLSVKNEWVPYFEKIYETHQKWFDGLEFHKTVKPVEAKTVAALVADNIEGGGDLIKKSQELIEQAKSSPLDTMENTLKQFKVVIFFCAERGIFDFPLKHLSFPIPSSTTPTPTPTPTPSPTPSSSNDNTHLEYQTLELLVENSVETQSLLFKLGYFKSPELDHPRLPAVVSLDPINDINDGKNNVELLYQRISQPNQKSYSQLSNRLSGLKVSIQPKPEVLQAEISEIIPTIQEYIQEFIDQLTEDRDKIMEKMKARAKKLKEQASFANDYLDLHWELELGDCQMVYLNSEKKERPRGVIKFSSSVEDELKKKIGQLEEELIKYKLLQAQSEGEKDDLQSRLKNRETESRSNYESLEQQYVELKFKCVELQSQNEDLSAQIAGLNRQKKK